MAQDSESRSLDKVIVRLPDGMRERIKSAAEANNRSMNAEIVAALEEKYPEPVDLNSIQNVVSTWAPKILGAPQGDIQESLIKKANAELARLDGRAYIDFYPDPRGVMRLGVTIFEFGNDDEHHVPKTRNYGTFTSDPD